MKRGRGESLWLRPPRRRTGLDGPRGRTLDDTRHVGAQLGWKAGFSTRVCHNWLPHVLPRMQALEMTPLETKLLAALRANATFPAEAEGLMAGLC
jgi:hypothetical protein